MCRQQLKKPQKRKLQKQQKPLLFQLGDVVLVGQAAQDLLVASLGAGVYLFEIGAQHIAHAHAVAADLVGIGRADALAGGADPGAALGRLVRSVEDAVRGSTRNDKKLVMDAFDDMIMRGCGKPGCIIHSDRGSTYCATEYRQLISKHDFLCSMSRKGDCWDNAPMESFWGKMKSEWLSDKYDTIQQAKRDVYEYVWHFYPKERPHETFGYLTPDEFYRQGKNEV